MSSSNEVRISYIEETVYGETPVAGNFSQARFTSDAISATPETVESALIRTDRLSSGQVLTGLTIAGDLSLEYSKSQDVDDFFEAAMMSSWQTSLSVGADLTIDTVAKEITRSAGDWNVDVEVGDVIKLSLFANSVNNTEVMVTEIKTAQVIAFVGPKEMVDEVGVGNSFQVLDKVKIGTTQKSFSIEKKFNDLTTKGINYTGMLVDGFTMTAAYGEIVNGSFSLVGENVTYAQQATDLITNGRTVNPAATSTSLNGSVDMAFLASSASGAFDGVDFCIQSIEISLANNSQPQNCVGKIGPQQYTLGTAQVNINLSAYLADETWQFLSKKISQESFSLGFTVKNSFGSYSFYVPALQLTFEDPGSEGANTDIILEMTGVAKVGLNGENSLTIFRSL